MEEASQSADAPPVIELAGVSFFRGGHPILQGIDWRIRPGEHWALLGANGAGKTTLLEIITGYRWPTGGSVSVLGQRFGEIDLRELRKSVGYVGAGLEYRIPGTQTAEEIVLTGIEAGLRLLAPPTEPEKERARTALEHLELGDFAERTFDTLSQGERKRVLIARSLINAPALLVLDEPCAGLDPKARNRFLEDVGHYTRRPGSPTVLFVTHHVEEIAPWIAKVLLLKDGRILAQESTERTLTDALLGEMLDCTCAVHRDGQTYRLDIGRASDEG